MKLPPAILTLASPTLLLAHGNHDAVTSLESRNALSSCSSRLTSRSHVEARSAKTNAFVNAYLSKCGLPSNYEARDDPPSTAGCVLAPEQEEGPFYVPNELIRSNITESEVGIDFLIDVQIMNVRTCKPMADVLVDFWGCNSTGFYSGVLDPGFGTGGITVNTTGLTFLRGIARTDKDGIAQVLTKFPGWYGGRTQHVHIKAHVNTTVKDNKILSGKVVHTGQLLFDQAILDYISTLPPYTLDRNNMTRNVQDDIFMHQTNTTGYQALTDIGLLGEGESHTEGLLGKMVLGIDPWIVPAILTPTLPPPGGFPMPTKPPVPSIRWVSAGMEHEDGEVDGKGGQ